MDEDIKVQVCRTCFNLISDKNFFSITGSLKDMLQVITTDLDLDITNASPVMCLKCAEALQEAFNFKTNFFESEEKIDSKISNLKHNKLNLRDIMSNDFSKGPKRKSTRTKMTHDKLCRTCLDTIQGNRFVSLNKNVDICLSSALDSCLPELDLNLTFDPVMCQTCYKTLQKMRDFKSACKKNESQIKTYSRRLRSNLSKKVNLHSIVQFLFNSGNQSEISEDIEVKTDPVEGGNEIKNENIDPSEKNEQNDCSHYVMVTMEPNDEEIVTQQVKREVKEELPVADSCLEHVMAKMESTAEEITTRQIREIKEEVPAKNCLEFVMVKMESTNGNAIEQNQIELVKNDAGLNSSFLKAKRQNPAKVKSKNKLNNHWSQSRSSKRLKQNKDSNKIEENSMTHCSNCDYKTKYKSNLRRHLFVYRERKHTVTQKKLHQCDKCNFATKWNIDLTRHMLSHIKPEALQCSRCAFSTNQNSLLIKHILSHVTAENIDKYSFLQLLKKTR